MVASLNWAWSTGGLPDGLSRARASSGFLLTIIFFVRTPSCRTDGSCHGHGLCHRRSFCHTDGSCHGRRTPVTAKPNGLLAKNFDGVYRPTSWGATNGRRARLEGIGCGSRGSPHRRIQPCPQNSANKFCVRPVTTNLYLDPPRPLTTTTTMPIRLSTLRLGKKRPLTPMHRVRMTTLHAYGHCARRIAIAVLSRGRAVRTSMIFDSREALYKSQVALMEILPGGTGRSGGVHEVYRQSPHHNPNARLTFRPRYFMGGTSPTTSLDFHTMVP